MGTIGLISATLALAFLAGVNIFTRDTNVLVTTRSPRSKRPRRPRRPPAYSLWPIAFAFGMAALIVGLVTYQAMFVIGLILLLAAGAEWMAQAWAERASADSRLQLRGAQPHRQPVRVPARRGSSASASSSTRSAASCSGCRRPTR